MAVFNFNQPNVGTAEMRKALFAIQAEIIKLRTTGGDPDAFNDLLDKLNTYFTAHNDAMTKANTYFTNLNSLNAKLNTYFTAFNSALTKLDADAGVTDTDYSATLAVDVAGAGSFTDLDVDVAGAGSFADSIVDVAGAGSFADLAIAGSSTLEFVP